MDGPIESFGVGEGLVGQMMRFEIVPDNFDVVEFGRVLGQPFDGEPVGAGGEGSGCRLAHVDRPVVEHDDDGFRPHARPRAIQAIERLQERNEIGAALGSACVHNEACGRCDRALGTVRISVCERAIERYAAMALMKRSPNMTAN